MSTHTLFTNNLNILNDKMLLSKSFNEEELIRMNQGRGEQQTYQFSHIPLQLVECFKTLENRKRFSPDPYLECSLELGLITREMMENHGLDNHKWSASAMMNQLYSGTDLMDKKFIHPQLLSTQNYSLQGTQLQPIDIGMWFFEMIKLSKELNEYTQYKGLCDFKFISKIVKINDYTIDLSDKLAQRYMLRFKEQLTAYNLRHRANVKTYGLTIGGVMDMLRNEMKSGKIRVTTSGNMDWKDT